MKQKKLLPILGIYLLAVYFTSNAQPIRQPPAQPQLNQTGEPPYPTLQGPQGPEGPQVPLGPQGQTLTPQPQPNNEPVNQQPVSPANSPAPAGNVQIPVSTANGSEHTTVIDANGNLKIVGPSGQSYKPATVNSTQRRVTVPQPITSPLPTPAPQQPSSITPSPLPSPSPLNMPNQTSPGEPKGNPSPMSLPQQGNVGVTPPSATK